MMIEVLTVMTTTTSTVAKVTMKMMRMMMTLRIFYFDGEELKVENKTILKLKAYFVIFIVRIFFFA